MVIAAVVMMAAMCGVMFIGGHGGRKHGADAPKAPASAPAEPAPTTSDAARAAHSHPD